MIEEILVVRTAELKGHVDFQGFLSLSEEKVVSLYNSIEIISMRRDRAENDPEFKQLVAYTVIRSGELYFSYSRGKDLGEARLHGNRSIGIGGHINSDDSANLFLDDHLKVAAYREVDEEVTIAEDYQLRLVGLLNDDSNDVGKVHLGLVYLVELEQPVVHKRERGVTKTTFTAVDELKESLELFETWSQLLIKSIHLL